MKTRIFIGLLMALTLLVSGMGCAKKASDAKDSSWEDQERERLAKERELRERLGKAAQELATMIHFDLDRYDIKPEYRGIMTTKAQILKANPEVKLVIEGHCDQRGTAEYNLALGERRARAAADFLVNLGIPATRLSTVSYGKERPLDAGSGEAAWSKNRRDEFRATY
ncbi:MAG: peptidoglycan-associated lipoprotein Pal [Desulfovibrionaceae bacterium]|nr:peptidoglycan-associated lipoprotein Pal [Desulfovibrionaceae bacterium]MBF0515423.1 peptidoglycan-associated lipoprotein Pal [Desulfovibrionaceae bacterium]